MIKLFFLTLVVYVDILDWIHESKLDQKANTFSLKNIHSVAEMTTCFSHSPFKQGLGEQSSISAMGKCEKLLEKTTDFRATYTQERSLT